MNIEIKVVTTLLENNRRVKEFLNNAEQFDILIKKLDTDEFERENSEYPEFLIMEKSVQDKEDHHSGFKKNLNLIVAITIIKRDLDVKNYLKSKKMKLLIDHGNQKIIKILQT